jgi:hypothetical protein
MRPTFIGQINLVPQRIGHRAKHLGQLIHEVCREFHCDASLNEKIFWHDVTDLNKFRAKPSSLQ